ncbi:MAG: hypothetical protein NUV67_01640 [archaeon]|nr:hypothetical protein [archaeon]
MNIKTIQEVNNKMIQLDYCKECHEVFQLSDNFGTLQIVSGAHRANCKKQ